MAVVLIVLGVLLAITLPRHVSCPSDASSYATLLLSYIVWLAGVIRSWIIGVLLVAIAFGYGERDSILAMSDWILSSIHHWLFIKLRREQLRIDAAVHREEPTISEHYLDTFDRFFGEGASQAYLDLGLTREQLERLSEASDDDQLSGFVLRSLRENIRGAATQEHNIMAQQRYEQSLTQPTLTEHDHSGDL